MKRLPIRSRLTLWYSIAFAAAALLLSATSWWMLRTTIDSTIHQDLQERVDDVRMQMQLVSPGASAVDLQKALDATYQRRDDGKWLQVLGKDGNWVYRSKRMIRRDTSLAPPDELRNGAFMSEFKQGDHTIRTLSSRIFAGGQSYSVEVGISMAKSQLLLRKFGLCLLLITPVVLAIAAGAGHFMSRRALEPVAAIVQEARRIDERNLSNRLPVSTSNDELSHLSTTLNHMLARIDSSFRSVRDFTANASHELRTPLTRIRSEAEITLFLPRGVTDYQQSLQKIHADTVEMSGLIDNLLTLARAEAGSERLRMEPVDLNAVIASVANEWSGVAKRLSIYLAVTRDAEMVDDNSTTVLADRTSLVRLLRIWLDNACKFTPAGGSISVRTHWQSECVWVTVEDSGIGIAPEEQKRIFERFYRVDSENSRRRSGAGLGLSLAVWIAEQHKTKIEVESVLGKGARFQISLRRVVAETTSRFDLPMQVG